MVGENHESGYPFLIVYFGIYLNKGINAYLIFLYIIIWMMYYVTCSFSLYVWVKLKKSVVLLFFYGWCFKRWLLEYPACLSMWYRFSVQDLVFCSLYLMDSSPHACMSQFLKWFSVIVKDLVKFNQKNHTYTVYMYVVCFYFIR